MRLSGKIFALSLATIAAASLSGCGEEEPPPRDQYPIINARVYDLQTAIADHNRAGIDSLLAAEILTIGEDSDSLLRYVYGPEGNRPFSRLAVRGIVHTHKLARVDCNIVDTAGAVLEPNLSLTFKMYDDSLWLLKRFEPIPDDALSRSDTLTEADSL